MVKGCALMPEGMAIDARELSRVTHVHELRSSSSMDTNHGYATRVTVELWRQRLLTGPERQASTGCHRWVAGGRTCSESQISQTRSA
jgi:hypothetical protein